MATTTAAPAQRQSHVGGAVMVSFYDGTHKIHSAFAHVLAEGPADENGNPSLSVAYPDPMARQDLLAGPTWWKAYKRLTGVLHADHESVKAGRESIAWGGIIASPKDLAAEGPEIPQPAGNASRPYFERETPKEAARVSHQQAGVVQAGSTPQPTVGSPVVNEGGPPAGDANGGAPNPAGPDGSQAATGDETPGGNSSTAV